MAGYTTVTTGAKFGGDWKMYFKDATGKVVSPFHDIPCWPDAAKKNEVSMVVEVPRWSNAKMEIKKEDPFNPIVQDEKKGKPRFVHNCFPHHGYIWNYGAIPQTWEDPGKVDEHTSCKGDDDPLDICEIGSKVHPTGTVLTVKVLGVMALIDEGETDWKVIGIDVNDPMAAELNNIEDVDKKMPGLISATNEWFRIYKMPAGKPENQFAFNGDCKDNEFAMKIIAETNEFWNALMSGADAGELKTQNSTCEGKSGFTPEAEANATVADLPAATVAALPADVDQWHYITL
jgi:inorganic pyrophosphatase